MWMGLKSTRLMKLLKAGASLAVIAAITSTADAQQRAVAPKASRQIRQVQAEDIPPAPRSTRCLWTPCPGRLLRMR